MRKLTALVWLALAACDEERSFTHAFLHKPFEGRYPSTWGFDHDLPINVFDPERGRRGHPHVLDWRGRLVELSWGDGDGHDGYDWPMPLGTPVLAAADGEVVFAGAEPPFLCGERTVAALLVRVEHTGPRADRYLTEYVHLDSVAVEVGQRVRAGDPLGPAGASGCASGPHLHFSVYRLTATGRVAIDPFGWAGEGPDPWSLEPDGAASEWLWLREPPDG